MADARGRTSEGPAWRKDYLLLVDSFIDTVAELLHVLLDTVDSTESHKVGNAGGDDAQADNPGKGGSSDIRILESEESEYGSGDAKNEYAPPGGESGQLVIEALHGHDDAFNEYPRCKYYRQGDRHENVVRQEDDTDDNLKDGGQHTGAAVGKEGLRLESENEP